MEDKKHTESKQHAAKKKQKAMGWWQNQRRN